MSTEPRLTTRQLADLSALADGTLDRRRRQDVQDWISSSAELQEMYRKQRQAVSALHRLREDRASDRLHSIVERERRQGAPRRLRLRLAVVLAVPVAAVIVILALALPAGTPGAPSISQAAALAVAGPQQPAPAPDSRAPRTRLAESVQDVYFPNWADSLGWRALGIRRDRLGGRLAITVYYAKGGKRVAYTILETPALPLPTGGRITRRDGFQLRTLLAAGRTIVTWRRAGHTCIVSATDVPVAVLQTLAGWRGSVIR